MLEENDINSYLYLGLLCVKIVHRLVRFLLRDLLANFPLPVWVGRIFKTNLFESTIPRLMIGPILTNLYLI